MFIFIWFDSGTYECLGRLQTERIWYWIHKLRGSMFERQCRTYEVVFSMINIMASLFTCCVYCVAWLNISTSNYYAEKITKCWIFHMCKCFSCLLRFIDCCYKIQHSAQILIAHTVANLINVLLQIRYKSFIVPLYLGTHYIYVLNLFIHLQFLYSGFIFISAAKQRWPFVYCLAR